MYRDAGEDHEGGAKVCPGESKCDDWAQPFDGPADQKEVAICHGCKFFETKPAAIDREEISEEEIEEIVDEVADIVAWENAGFATDWSVYPFSTKKLARIWREYERDVDQLRAHRLQTFLRAWMKES